MRYSAIILLTSLLLLSGCYDDHGAPPNSQIETEANLLIGELREFCTEGCSTIESEIICEGRITTSDREGNFYRSFCLEDETGAVEVKIGTYNYASQFPVGLKVSLRLLGTAVMIKEGVIQVGLPPMNYDDEPREFESQEVIDRHIVRSTSVESITPKHLALSALKTSLCGRFIRVENLHRSPSESEDIENGYYRFCNDNEEEIFLYISPYADFTLPEISASGVAIQGILYYTPVGIENRACFVIRVRSKDDVSTTDSHI